MNIKRTFRSILTLLILGAIFFGCQKNEIITITKENTISTDQAELERYICLDKYKPQDVKWIYYELGQESVANSTTSNRFKLQAILEFKKETVEGLMDDYAFLSVTYKWYLKEELGFEWLDWETDQKLQVKIAECKELNARYNNYEVHYYDAYFFEKGNLKSGGFIPLDDTTILLSMVSPSFY